MREAVSADLDGEPTELAPSVVQRHLAGCAQCAAWAEDAARLTRALRLQRVDVPDLSERIVADVTVPARRLLRRRWALRIALAITGVIQLGIAAPPLFGDSMALAMNAHAGHESVAWNLALGAGLLAVAAAPRRVAGMTLLLGVFLAVLTVLSVPDVVTGAVGAARLATHLAVLAGLGLLVALERSEPDVPHRPVASRATPFPAAEHDTTEEIA